MVILFLLKKKKRNFIKEGESHYKRHERIRCPPGKKKPKTKEKKMKEIRKIYG